MTLQDFQFNEDASAFRHQLPDNFISIDKGKISSPKQNETITRYYGYFSLLEFLKWDVISKSIIEFSDN